MIGDMRTVRVFTTEVVEKEYLLTIPENISVELFKVMIASDFMFRKNTSLYLDRAEQVTSTCVEVRLRDVTELN